MFEALDERQKSLMDSSEMKVEMSNPKKLGEVLPASLIFLGWAKFSLSSLVLSLLSFALSLHTSVIGAMR